MIGEGNLKKDLERRIAETGLKERVFFLPAMAQEELADYYRASDVLALTSNYEGFARCVLEALGCGTPAVVTKVGALERVVRIGYSGEIAEDFHPSSISKSLEKVLAAPEAYSVQNCLSSIQDYRPREILEPIYEKIRRLYEENYGKKAL